ncbi:hypothetical protein [Mucilaginibacter boryungensis]|uniref:Uncharacterized protein n=1 Tax=Mucilaginibacter boryungensis TaxID=768480 RepID=A0ABR9XJS5_9SPHI|nr:hypothetical protein [Mucilaginibacter boryungensis]MBE9667634.1 hypothetical protein [Mucilaginibacter boryungensis]
MANDTGQPDVPQLSSTEQTGAVAIVLGTFIFLLFIIFAWWPADPGLDRNASFVNRPFHVRPVSAPATTAGTAEADAAQKKLAVLTVEITKLGKPTDTVAKKTLEADLKLQKELQDNLTKLKEKAAAMKLVGVKPHCTIQLGNLLLILVAAFGFLGNMIHVSRSLTYYIGMKLFQRSWIAWYFIKPFMAAGLALIVYLATNSSVPAAGTPVNLFTIMLTAGLTGLFTDVALQKLKIVFDALVFGGPNPTGTPPGDGKGGGAGGNGGPNPNGDPAAKKVSVDMSKVVPVKIDPKAVNHVKIPGANLDPKTIVVTINDEVVAKPRVTAADISFDYQPTDAALTKFVLKVTDGTPNLKEEKTWGV